MSSESISISTLKAQIQANALQSFYVFVGPEWQVQRIYIRQIAKTLGAEVKYIETIADIYKKLKNKSFIQSKYVYVLIDDKELMSVEKIQDQISTGLLGQDILILQLTSVDKRTKFYNKYKDIFVEFEPLSDAILKKYIRKQVDLSDKCCTELINICEHDYGRILLETDKIWNYHCVTELPYDSAFYSLLKNGAIYLPPQDAIFDLVAAILNRDVNTAFDLLQQARDIGEANLVILSVLYTNAKAVLQVQACESSDIGQSTGLTSWQIKNAQKHLHKYSIGELVNILRLIQKVESGIKNGVIDEDISIDYVLTEVM